MAPPSASDYHLRQMRSVAEITADLTAAYSARRKAMEATSYTAAGRSVQRNLGELNRTIQALEAEKAAAEAAGGEGQGTLTVTPTIRGW